MKNNMGNQNNEKVIRVRLPRGDEIF